MSSVHFKALTAFLLIKPFFEAFFLTHRVPCNTFTDKGYISWDDKGIIILHPALRFLSQDLSWDLL